MSIVQVTTRDTQLEKQRIGKPAISLTNFDNTLEPAIAAGSVVEIGGSLFEVTEDEAITGWAGIANATDAYIKLVVGTPVTAAFTTDAPTWSSSKQGWYDGIDRFVAVIHRGATAADFESKGIIPGVQGNRFSSLEIARDLNVQRDADVDGLLTPIGGIANEDGTPVALRVGCFEIGYWNMNATQQITVAPGTIPVDDIVDVHVIIIDDSEAQNPGTGIGVGLEHCAADGHVDGRLAIDYGNDNLILWRLAGGLFDGVNYEQPAVNRGYVTVVYTP